MNQGGLGGLAITEWNNWEGGGGGGWRTIEFEYIRMEELGAYGNEVVLIHYGIRMLTADTLCESSPQWFINASCECGQEYLMICS